jgi:putative MATE family efflux protein
MNKKSVFTKLDTVFLKKLGQLAIPATIQSLMLALVAVADALMLGSIEQNAMAAVTLATQIQFIQNMILTSIMCAASVLGAQYWGKGDRKNLVNIFHIAIKLGAAVSIVFFLACELAPGFLMRIFTNEVILQEIGSGYLRIAGWSYLMTGISQSYLSIMKVSEHTRESAMISSGAVVLNIILNYIFIFGHFGLSAMEVRGAALATALTRITELTICILLSLRPGYVHPAFQHIFRRSKLLFSDFCKVMLPLLGASLFWGVGFTSYTAFMGHLGTDAAAANSVAAVVRDVVCCITDGMAVGGGILIGNELGAGALKQARRYGDRLVIIAFLIGLISTLLMLLLAPQITSMVALSEGARECLWGMFRVLALYMIGRAVNTIIINGIFAAGGDTLYDMYSLAVCMWCLAIPLAAAGTFFLNWPPVVVYACTCLDEVGKIPWTIIHYKKYKWVKNLTRSCSA